MPVAAAAAPPTEGVWTYQRDARGSIALFGAATRDALFTLRCDRAARRMFVSVVGTAQGPLTLRAMTTVKTVPLTPTGGNPPYAAAELQPQDAILDALAFSRGSFEVGFDATRLTIPSWPEFARVVEDCRS